MSPTADQVLQQALSLDEKDRASVAGALIESLHGEVEPGASEAWENVIQQRIHDLDTGAVKTIPWSEVRNRLFCGFE